MANFPIDQLRHVYINIPETTKEYIQISVCLGQYQIILNWFDEPHN